MKAVGTFLFTTIAVGAGLYLYMQMPCPPREWWYYLYVGFSEEVIKILLILPIFYFGKDRKVFILSAIVFAVIENFLYLYSTPTWGVLIGRWVISMPVHIGIALIFLFGFRNWKGFILGFFLAVIWHTMMNLSLTWGMTIVPILCSYPLFLLAS